MNINIGNNKIRSENQNNYQPQKTEYAFNKTRTDSKQLPLQYFYKNLLNS